MLSDWADRMKVLHVIPSISLLRGGPSVAVLEMVGALIDCGVEASILTTNDDGPDVDPSLPIGSWCERQGVPVLAFDRWSPPLRLLREFIISPGLNRWLAAHLQEYDLLHVHALFSWPSTLAMAQARHAGVPYVLSTIGQLCHWSLGRRSHRKRLLLRLIERRNLDSVAGLHFTTETERQEAADLGLRSFSFVLPLGVRPPLRVIDAARSASQASGLRDSQSGAVFLFLSRLHPKKQLEHLLGALALLQQRRPDALWQLHIAGDGEPTYLAALQQKIASLGLSGRCIWLGFLEGEAKWQALLRADWFVLPSASENFGIAAIEALAAGTPPILSPGVAVALTIAEAKAGLICSSDPFVLSRALEDGLAGPPAAMRSAALDLAAKSYGWPAIAERLEATYASLLLGQRPRRCGAFPDNGAQNSPTASSP